MFISMGLQTDGFYQTDKLTPLILPKSMNGFLKAITRTYRLRTIIHKYFIDPTADPNVYWELLWKIRRYYQWARQDLNLKPKNSGF
jgi:hypothetical protein